MVYDDETSQRPHLSLPLETLDELVARATSEPAPNIAQAITEAVQARKDRLPGRDISPSRIKADLWRTGIDVTVEQVAQVLITLQ